MADVFISYSRRDEPFVERLRQALAGSDKDVWVDREDIGPAVVWRREIELGIEGADIFAFVISPDSVRSAHCLEELEDAVAAKKLIVPVVYRDAPDGSLPAAIAEAEWVFLRDQDDAAGGIDRLVDALETDLGWRDQHTRLAGRVREWIDAERDSSYLLRGADLREAEGWLGRQDGHRAAPTPGAGSPLPSCSPFSSATR